MIMNREKRLIVFAILFLMVFSSYFIINKTLSKDKTNVVAGGETDVARWEMIVDNQGSDNIELPIGGEGINYTLNITRKSDVAHKYSIYLTNVPNNIAASVDSGEFQTSVNGEITFEDAGEFDADSQDIEETHTITFKALSGAQEVSDIQIGLDVKFTQNELE